MLKTLDVLIGATTVLLIFSMAVTVLTQALTAAFNRRGGHLKDGLTDLIQQLGLSQRDVAAKVADAVLRHPMLSEGKAWWGLRDKMKLGTVIHREEFTKVLMDAASGNTPDLWKSLGDAAAPLKQMLKDNGITDPSATLKAVRTMAMQLEASHPELATDVRQTMALLHTAESDYVAKVNAWFDQTIDRVSQRFTKYAHYVTVAIAIVVVLAVQLDMIAVVDRLSLDENLRNQVVTAAIKSVSTADKAQAAGDNSIPKIDQGEYYNILTTAGLIVNPLDRGWADSWKAQKIPGMVLAALMISLGAPFWYNILKNLIGLRSLLAQKDDAQRMLRQTTQDPSSPGGAAAPAAPSVPASLKGERGDLGAVG